MRRLITIAGLAWPMLATAQISSSPRVLVDSGASVRVLMRNGLQLHGELLRLAADSLALRRDADGKAVDTVVALSQVSAVESRKREHTLGSALAGLGIGTVTGLVAGFIGASQSMKGCRGDSCGMAYLAVPLFAGVGGLAGLVVGSVRTSEGWEPVWRSDTERP
jgi:hypothetical protein